jgi:hypothetical protein
MSRAARAGDSLKWLPIAFIPHATLFRDHSLPYAGVLRDPGHASLKRVFNRAGCYAWFSGGRGPFLKFSSWLVRRLDRHEHKRCSEHYRNGQDGILYRQTCLHVILSPFR